MDSTLHYSKIAGSIQNTQNSTIKVRYLYFNNNYLNCRLLKQHQSYRLYIMQTWNPLVYNKLRWNGKSTRLDNLGSSANSKVFKCRIINWINNKIGPICDPCETPEKAFTKMVEQHYPSQELDFVICIRKQLAWPMNSILRSSRYTLTIKSFCNICVMLMLFPCYIKNSGKEMY